jgi:hypothetical protein
MLINIASRIKEELDGAAKEAVKYNIRAEGLKLRDFPSRDIARMAEAFVGNHRDTLLAGALRAIERSPELQRMLEKEQREWAQRIAKQSGRILDHYAIS